ncbi:MAG: bifunctional UDP-N-acetylmuramoyl-tripeptide:D-alanyl-D-alanine ligase/alanine racemase [Cytophagales bacterium]|nr:bifunctional UDP-N-acetylmuramoyl-tripeptide:D-alanyl-D-alanine ligase/alanine racemase [Cytophagales bacterium]
MLFSELIDITGGELLLQTEDMQINKFSIDSRKIIGRVSEVFIAIKGANNDGHDFISNVHKKGVRCFILEKSMDIPPDNAILVDSSIMALQQIAMAHRSKWDYPVIGITGSNGKTTVKEWLATLLSSKFRVIKSPKSYNSQVGVPISVLEMEDHGIGVFEAGISRVGEMKRLANVIQPTIGIFTNIGEAHSSGFGSIEQKIEEKIQLFDSAEHIICCADQLLAIPILRKRFGSRLVTWSIVGTDADYQYTKTADGIKLNNHDLHIELPFSNHYQVENALHAVTAALKVGVDKESICQRVCEFRAIPMRLELKKALNNCYLIDDSYNNDLLGLEVALDFMNEQSPGQTKTVILSDILQSALSEDELYDRVGQLLNDKHVKRVITVGQKIADRFSAQHYESTLAFLENLPSFKNETILLKGARDFEFERIAQKLQNQSHGTVLEVNFEAIRNNLNAYRNLLAANTKIMVMVKAFAYGAGLSEIASLLQHERVDYLGVAYVDEAIELRQNGINIPIMIMNPEETDFWKFEQHNLQAEIYSLDILKRFIESKFQVPIHLKMETGMNRLGFSEEELQGLKGLLNVHSKLEVESVFTHFSSSDSPRDDEFTNDQATRFEKMSEEIMATLDYTPIRHAVNSSGIVRFPNYHYDMVRLGIGLYGFDPTPALELAVVGTLKTNITQIKKLRKGDSIGYSRKGRAKDTMQVAVIPIGYADGYLRVYGNGNASVLINGQLVPTIGNICMDMMMADVTGLEVSVGDEAIIFGEYPSIAQLATWAKTIPYEVLTNISQRVKRVYVSE